ncbi:hypothetical protein [Shewanella surugensis]|uniref:Uncharacterized protein n=1 Tax=Shewanella surugensis TaxID=212020 RepID=A0ABT0LJC7_9GAMM|nr:hypothetical protein [Shewanella surugensis]MCL1127817.1 hypothetical protein [Shewanella surugensis]
MLKKIPIYSLLLMSTNCFAGADAGQFSSYTKIQQLFIEGSETSPVATLKFETSIPDTHKNDDCLSQYITIDLSTEKGKSMYALALSARMAEKEIRVTLPFCSGTRPLVNSINL